MPRTLYSYQLRKEAPLLTDAEYEPVARALDDRVRQIKAYRKEHKCSLEEASAKASSEAMDLYEQMTSCRLDHPDMLYAVRLSSYGRPCPECAKPFRTPRAKLCAECGHELPPGEMAGPASLE